MANITILDLAQSRELDDVDMTNVAGGANRAADTIYRVHGTNEQWSVAPEVDLGAHSYAAITGAYRTYSGR